MQGNAPPQAQAGGFKDQGNMTMANAGLQDPLGTDLTDVLAAAAERGRKAPSLVRAWRRSHILQTLKSRGFLLKMEIRNMLYLADKMVRASSLAEIDPR